MCSHEVGVELGKEKEIGRLWREVFDRYEEVAFGGEKEELISAGCYIYIYIYTLSD